MARSAASSRLIALHQAEFDTIHAEEREKRGLPGNPREAQRQANIAKHFEALRKLGINEEALLEFRDELAKENEPWEHVDEEDEDA
jgi:hypothetical protein